MKSTLHAFSPATPKGLLKSCVSLVFLLTTSFNSKRPEKEKTPTSIYAYQRDIVRFYVTYQLEQSGKQHKFFPFRNLCFQDPMKRYGSPGISSGRDV